MPFRTRRGPGSGTGSRTGCGGLPPGSTRSADQAACSGRQPGRSWPASGASTLVSAARRPVSRRRRGAFLVFDLSIPKLLVLGVLALVIFGPDQLPKMAAQAGRALRELRRMADGAKADLRDGLGPEFADFDINDLNPRHFVRKHLLEDPEDEDEQSSSPRETAASTLVP